MPNDLYESFKILKDLGSSQPTLAFFNCGEESGARYNSSKRIKISGHLILFEFL